MQLAFPPLDHRPVAQAAPEPIQHGFSGEEPRTAGPAARAYQAATSETSFHSALSDSPSPAGEAPSFGDFIDMINPLQHIPLVNLAYRALTGDQIGGAAQVVGGALFGGPIGAIAGTASAIIEHQTGHSTTDVAISAFSGEKLSVPARTYADLSAPVTKRYNFNQSA